MHTDTYFTHFNHDYIIEIPTDSSEGNKAKIKVYNSEAKELIRQDEFILKKIPKIYSELNEEDARTLAEKTNEIFASLNFD